MMTPYSYHMFYFPFKWKMKGHTAQLFSEQTDLSRIHLAPNSQWERTILSESTNFPDQADKELYGEMLYYFEFVHAALYDKGDVNGNLLLHFERKEIKLLPGNIFYTIKIKKEKGEKIYRLKVDDIILNLFDTGVGVLSFYLKNEQTKEPEDILNINQFGRRIMPAFYDDLEMRSQIANSISIEGLNGNGYSEDFSGYTVNDVWIPARFICRLIEDLSPDIKVTPVIDDRMFVSCWYGNNDLSKILKKDPGFTKESNPWYQYLFVDKMNEVTCQNKEMKDQLLAESTYCRWQNSGTLFGVSRYSFVALTDTGYFSCNILGMHMRTIYARMVELIMVQHASMLRFSGEVTRLCDLNDKNSRDMSRRISSLYKEYIRFINRYYFREVTAQDQGIELYRLFKKQLGTDEQIKNLNREISELYQYSSLTNEYQRNENMERLTKIATIFVPAALLASLFGMNSFSGMSMLACWSFPIQLVIVLIVIIISLIYFNRKSHEKK